ncbi:hypothetical protein JCM5296_000299 [Sporobolomyces johnsonii]
MLLLDLPPELLSLIISLVGGPYDWQDYGNRLEDLRNCCLVSRAFRQIAQPELFAIIEVEDRKPLEAFRAAAKATGLGRTTATAVFRRSSWGEDQLTAEEVRAALEELPSLREVRISWIDGIDMAWLAGLPELRHLVLYKVTLTSSSPSFALPRLVQLSACWTETDPLLSPACFTAETTPCLRLAAIVVPYDCVVHGQPLAQPSPELAAKLEIAVVDFVSWSDAHSDFPSCSLRAVIDCPFDRCRLPFDPTLPPISHLRLSSAIGTQDRWMRRSSVRKNWIEDQVTDAVLAFDTLADMLTASHPVVSTLQTIHLSIELGSDEVQEFHPYMFRRYQHLSNVCAQKGVEILLGSYPEIETDSFIPRRTLDWMRAQGSRD